MTTEFERFELSEDTRKKTSSNENGLGSMGFQKIDNRISINQNVFNFFFVFMFILEAFRI